MAESDEQLMQRASRGELAAFGERIGAVLKEEGPVFVVLKVIAGATYPQDFAALHSAELRRQFAAALSKS